MNKCISCGNALLGKGTVNFECPNDSTIIGRCARCKTLSITYKCPSCGFEGP